MAKHNVKYVNVHRVLMAMRVGDWVPMEVPTGKTTSYFQKVVHAFAARYGMEIATRSLRVSNMTVLFVTLLEVE